MSGPSGRALWDRPVRLASALAALVFLPSLAGGFVYDDQHVVVDERGIRDLSRPATVVASDPARPLLALTWSVNYAVAGLTPWPYHLVNVLVHAGSAALVASLFLWMARRSGAADPRRQALLAAAWFAVTPMACETVAYVSSRSTALASLLALASLRVGVVALESRSAVRLAAAVGLHLLALATKEEAASVPLLLLLLDYFFLAGRSWRALTPRLPRHLPFLALPALGLVGRRVLTGEWLPAPALDPARYALTQVAAFPGYLIRALVPWDPALYRGQPPAPWPPDAKTLAWCGLTAAVVVLAHLLRRRLPTWSFAVAWLAAGLLPSSSLVALKEMVVDHRAYLGGVGVAYAAGVLLWRAGQARPSLAVAVLALLALRTGHYQWVLIDPVRTWTDAVRRAPGSAEAHVALGEAWLERAKARARTDPDQARSALARAEVSLRTATALDPGDVGAWTNLGAFYIEIGRLEDAARAMSAAAQAAPGDARIHDNLGMVLSALGREADAVAAFEAAVAGAPALAQPRINLARLLIARGDPERARALLEEASRLELDPQDDEALVELQQRLGPP